MATQQKLDGFDFCWVTAAVAVVYKGRRNSELKSMSFIEIRGQHDKRGERDRWATNWPSIRNSVRLFSSAES